MTTALSQLNIESELSYAYLHAVASHAGINCKCGNRHDDNSGIDAIITAWGPFGGNAYRTEIDIKVQLKATIVEPTRKNDKLSYFFKGVDQYNDLRSELMSTPRILVVLFLPSEPNQWIDHTPDQLVMKKCAYWVSLLGAPKTDNDTGVTVYLPDTQVFSPDNLHALACRIARNDIPKYEE